VRREGIVPNFKQSSLISDYRDSKGKGKLKGKGKRIIVCVFVP
jgi:hypothetical protein